MPSPRRLRGRSLAVLILGIGLVVGGVQSASSADALEPVGGHLVVTVTDGRSAAPLEGATVALHPADWDGTAAPLLTAVTDAEGAADLDEGQLDPTVSYKVLVEAPGHEARWAADPTPVATADLATAYAVDAVAGAATSVALPQLRAAVTGVVQDAGTATPVRGALVCLDDATTETVDPQVCRLSRADGAFTLPAWGGSYLLRAAALERASYVGTEPIVVAPGASVAVDPVPLELLPQLVPLLPATVSTTAPVVGTAVSLTVPTFAEAGVRTDVAWFVGHRPVPVALGQTFVPLKQYAGKQLSVRALSTADGHRPAITDLAVGVVVAPVVAPAHKPVRLPLAIVKKPAKVRRAKVGAVAAVTAPVVAGGARVSYQWLADGKAIKGATKRTYRVTKQKRHRVIAVRVTATRPGRAPYVTVVRLGVVR